MVTRSLKLAAISFPIFADAISQCQIYDPARRSGTGLGVWHSQIAEEGLKLGVGVGLGKGCGGEGVRKDKRWGGNGRDSKWEGSADGCGSNA